jgi:outer membrane protein assembly factor BamE (lipoprotein component of BamABCDE complex)
MKRFALAVALAASLAGCLTTASVPKRVAMLHQGMTQQEVTALLGKPHNVTHQGVLTVYDYVFDQDKPAAFHAGEPAITSYYVIVGPDGLVRSYGPN